MDGFDVLDKELPDLIDEKYRVNNVIAKETRSPANILSSFSRDVKNDRYQIRKADTQMEWGRRKTDLQRRIAKLLLMTDYGLNALLDMCETLALQSGKRNEFTVILRNEEGNIELSHDKSNVIVVRDMIKDFIAGKSDMTREEMLDVIATHYNLSYHHFIKKHVNHIINESEQVTKLLATWEKCKFNVMKHPMMVKEAKRYMTIRENGRKSAIRMVKDKLEKLFFELNVEIEQVMLRKEALNKILAEGELDGGFVLRALKLLNSSFTKYRNQLTETNIRMVTKKAYENQKRGAAAGLNVLELISEGSEGMIKAAEMYVSCAEVKFTTYAVRWVDQKITRHIKNTNPVRVPIHCKDLMFKICKHFNDIGYKEGVPPPAKGSVEKVLATDISDSVWEMSIRHYNNVAISVSCNNTGSFEDGGMTFDAILGENTEQDNDALGTSVYSEQILSIAKERLTKNEFEVLYRHFMHEQSYDSIHSHLDRDYSSKSISMIKTRAISKLQEAVQELMPEEFNFGGSLC